MRWLESYDRVTKSSRKVYLTIRNSLVTFSKVHLTKVCKLSPRCQTIDKVGPFCRPIKSSDFVVSSNIEHVIFSTIKSANFLDIGRHGDCLQWEMNIFILVLYFVRYSMMFIFVH